MAELLHVSTVKIFLINLQALKWELCPVTIVSWLNLYLQVDALKDDPKVLLPQYSQEKFIQIAQVSFYFASGTEISLHARSMTLQCSKPCAGNILHS